MSTSTETLSLPKPHLRRWGFLREMLDLVILVGAIYALVNLATVRFIVQGPSMEPTFETNQFLIVSRIHYMVGNPERGDVIVFHYPGNPKEDYIKRVIGVPGDLIEVRDTQVYVNGQLLYEPYINEPCQPIHCPDKMWELGADEYFVMGDNRNRSSDSRGFRTHVRKEHIVGEVFLRYWPPQNWGLMDKIGYPGD